MNTVLIKQDPVMVANHKDEPPDPDTDFILQDSLPLFDNRYCLIFSDELLLLIVNIVQLNGVYRQCGQLKP